MNYLQTRAGLKQALADVKEHCSNGGALYFAAPNGRVRRVREGWPDSIHNPADIQGELSRAKYIVTPGSIAQGLEKLEALSDG